MFCITVDLCDWSLLYCKDYKLINYKKSTRDAYETKNLWGFLNHLRWPSIKRKTAIFRCRKNSSIFIEEIWHHYSLQNSPFTNEHSWLYKDIRTLISGLPSPTRDQIDFEIIKIDWPRSSLNYPSNVVPTSSWEFCTLVRSLNFVCFCEVQ